MFPGDGTMEIRMIQNPALKLFLCGAAALFWELVLIRWMGSHDQDGGIIAAIFDHTY
jgi:hypothetical protein